MSKMKRQDSKGRNLRLGESQRKDGRYVYKYTDIFGKPQFVYAWKLVPTDCTYRDLCVATKTNYVEILNFRYFFKHIVFTSEGDKIRNKEIKNYINVSVVVDIECRKTRN